MRLTDNQCYQALQSHDTRFDGLFFTCVISTGVYCRPVCPAIIPKRQNCTFVFSSIQAEKNGFRPCLRCRPEYAPQSDIEYDAVVWRMSAYINETLLMDETLADVSAKFSVSSRHAQRLFLQTFGVEPKQYVTSRRLLFAKQLLQDTTLSVTDIAFAAGFNSRGRLTINMQKAYGFPPERLRKMNDQNTSDRQLIRLRTDYRPPFHWMALLEFLAGRATPAEWVQGDSYHRIVDGHEIIVTNDSDKNCVYVAIPIELSRQAHAILAKVRFLFDLDANPTVIASVLSRDPLLAEVIKKYPGIRVAGCWDPFEMLLRVIVGQQVSVAAATTVMRRIVDAIGGTSEKIAASSPSVIASMGMPLKRAQTIHIVAGLVQDGLLDLNEKNPQKFYDQLLSVPGIGPWTAEYLRIRVLRWPDAFPAGDLGLQKAVIPGERQTERWLQEYSTQWRPWRSYATLLLWKSLENKGG